MLFLNTNTFTYMEYSTWNPKRWGEGSFIYFSRGNSPNGRIMEYIYIQYIEAACFMALEHLYPGGFSNSIKSLSLVRKNSVILFFFLFNFYFFTSIQTLQFFGGKLILCLQLQRRIKCFFIFFAFLDGYKFTRSKIDLETFPFYIFIYFYSYFYTSLHFFPVKFLFRVLIYYVQWHFTWKIRQKKLFLSIVFL